MSQKINIPAETLHELTEVRNELISIVMRMEKELRINPYENKNMRIEVKKLRELLK